MSAEVVYVGYGITAPELNYDEYQGLDVKGKIVLMEVEVPVDPGKKPAEFAKWRPYSFHQYKMKNARDHGAAGVLYNYPIVNPNCAYFPDLLWTAVGDKVVNDIFRGSTAETKKQVVKRLRKKHRPQSFATNVTATIKNVTEHHGDGVGRNVIAYLPGSDPVLKNETVILSAHLDHLGMNPSMMPGANDNASGVAVLMAVAEALSQSGLRPQRNVAFVFFGAEEQRVRGSSTTLTISPALEKDEALVNLDGVGRGKKIYALAAKNYPALWKYFAAANRELVRTDIAREYFHNRARPRLDAARFMWAGIPSLSFSAGDAPELPYPVYHTRRDVPDILTPAIMVDLGRLVYAAVTDLAAYRPAAD